MGGRIDDLHAPTPMVASGPTSNGYGMPDHSRKTLLELMDERDKVQSELFALGSVLESHNVDMQTPLLTPDGFPRADIDVAQIRVTRSRIVHLKNDYKWLMQKIEKGLEEHHRNIAANPEQASPAPPTRSAAVPIEHPATSSSIEAPFAKVNSVARGSPAEEAGLQVGDKVTKFGWVNWTNHDNLSKVAQVVQGSEGQVVTVKILRSQATATSQAHELQLTPRHNWGGRGMLGCHLLPL